MCNEVSKPLSKIEDHLKGLFQLSQTIRDCEFKIQQAQTVIRDNEWALEEHRAMVEFIKSRIKELIRDAKNEGITNTNMISFLKSHGLSEDDVEELGLYKQI